MKKLIAVLSLLLLPSAAYCGANSFGELALAELSARGNSMADACVSLNGDVFGVYYNPALSAAVPQAGMTFQRGYADDSTGGLSLSLPQFLGGKYNAGFSVLYYTAGDIDLYNLDGDLKTVNSETDYLGIFSLSRKYGNVTAGASVKMLHTELFESASASAFMFDAGLLTRFRTVNLGFAVQNLGGRMALGDDTETVPVVYRAGASRGFFMPNDDTLTPALDVVKTGDEPVYVRAGVEYICSDMLALRAGYEFKNTVSEANSFRAGIGIIVDPIQLDYAFVPYQNLGATHHLAVTYKFAAANKGQY